MHQNSRSSYKIIINEDKITRGNANNKSDESLANTSVKHHENLNNNDENYIIKKVNIFNACQVKIWSVSQLTNLIRQENTKKS